MAELRVLETKPQRAQQSVIDMLDEVRAEADAGKVHSIAIAIVLPDGSVNTSRSAADNAPALLGALALAHSRLLKEMEAEAGE